MQKTCSLDVCMLYLHTSILVCWHICLTDLDNTIIYIQVSIVHQPVRPSPHNLKSFFPSSFISLSVHNHTSPPIDSSIHSSPLHPSLLIYPLIHPFLIIHPLSIIIVFHHHTSSYPFISFTLKIHMTTR